MSFKIVVLAAGKSTRMLSSTPKVCHKVGGRSLLSHVLNASVSASPNEIAVVVGVEHSLILDEINNFSLAAGYPVSVFVQTEQCGTANAVLCARDVFAQSEDNILVLFGDTPLITLDTLAAMRRCQSNNEHAVVVLGMQVDPPNQYGRIVCDELQQHAFDIIECADANEDQKNLPICNSGIMLINGRYATQLLSMVQSNNAKGEYYLTDVVKHANDLSLSVGLIIGDEKDLLGINSRLDLAQVETIFQNRCREQAMRKGATLIDPSSVYFSYDTILGQDVEVHPNVCFGPGVQVRSGAVIRSNCVIEGAVISSGAQIGPFAHLRSGTIISTAAKIGNFVEVKNSVIGERTKVSHLSYIGDAELGKGVNIGAGTVTCNYNGYKKFKTNIGDGVFVGSNASLIAPVTLGEGSIVAAGSVVTKDVQDNSLVVARSPQCDYENAAIAYRKKHNLLSNNHKKG